MYAMQRDRQTDTGKDISTQQKRGAYVWLNGKIAVSLCLFDPNPNITYVCAYAHNICCTMSHMVIDVKW